MSTILQNWQAILAIIAAVFGVINLIAHFILNAEHKDHQLVTDDIATWLTQAKGAIDRGTVTPRLPSSVRNGAQSVQYQQDVAIPPQPTNKGYMKLGFVSILLTCAVAATFACAALGVDSAKLAADEIDCGKQAIRDALPDALPLVTIALAGQNAEAALDVDARELGSDVVTCAVAVAVRDLAPKVPATPSGFKADTATDTHGRPSPSTTPLASAVVYGRAYLAAQTRKPMLK